MSDVMLFGVLKMPYKMAMATELSRLQFYQRVQELVKRVESQPARQSRSDKEWVGLTDEEITTIWRKSEHMTVVEVARAIEAKLREKNQ